MKICNSISLVNLVRGRDWPISSNASRMYMGYSINTKTTVSSWKDVMHETRGLVEEQFVVKNYELECILKWKYEYITADNSKVRWTLVT
jgi:N-acetylglucosamine kinase-like BadF-type ATPase